MQTRRLPVFLLIDCSESMAGEAIESVNKGVQTLVAELCKQPFALATVYLSVITFARQAKQVVPLTELMQFNAPTFSVRPGTALGGALRLLTQCLKRDVVRSTVTEKGDYRPLVFLMTDGQPTDEWEVAAGELRGDGGPGVGNIYAIACGEDADHDVLEKITDVVLAMPELTPESILKLFIWLSSSIERASSMAHREGDPHADAMSRVAGVPTELLEIIERTRPLHVAEFSPAQVFLHATCMNTKRLYLMRYRKHPGHEGYVADKSHPLDYTEEEEGISQPPISSNQLMGCPPCPYCENSSIGVCQCGALFCSPAEVALGSAVICPKCNANLSFAGSGGAFDLKRTMG